MHKKTLIISGITLFAVVVGLTVILASVHKKAQPRNGSKPAQHTVAVTPACKAFTLADATAILGPGTKIAPGNGSNDVSSSVAAISDCSYVVGGASNSDAASTSAVLVVRSAKTAQGAEYNKSIFGIHKPAGKEDVPGVGDAAFWDATLSQLDLLQGDKWYIIGNMKGSQANSGTLETSKAIYEQVKHKL